MVLSWTEVSKFQNNDGNLFRHVSNLEIAQVYALKYFSLLIQYPVQNCTGPSIFERQQHGAILFNEAEVFSLPITNPNGRPMLSFDWFIHQGLILHVATKFWGATGVIFCLSDNNAFRTKWTIASGEALKRKLNFEFRSSTCECLSYEFELKWRV